MAVATPVTGTIARTVTNLRAGATSPVAGIVHAGVLALIVLVAAPLALHIPLAVLAGILLFVAWNMGEERWKEFIRLRHFNHYRLLMLGTFFLTVVFDLAGGRSGLGAGLRAVRAPHGRAVSRRAGALAEGLIEAAGATIAGTSASESSARPRRVWRLHGALFFGAAAKIDPIVAAIEAGEALELWLDLRDLFALDTTGLEGLGKSSKTVRPARRTAAPRWICQRGSQRGKYCAGEAASPTCR